MSPERSRSIGKHGAFDGVESLVYCRVSDSVNRKLQIELVCQANYLREILGRPDRTGTSSVKVRFLEKSCARIDNPVRDDLDADDAQPGREELQPSPMFSRLEDLSSTSRLGLTGTEEPVHGDPDG
jgi:hypothetical protein